MVYGSYVFFDVHWLADVLKPLLSDRLVTSYGCTTLGGKEVPISASSVSLKRFERKGILEPILADVLWGKETAPHVLKTLESAGLTFPRAGDERDGVVILLRLPTKRPEPVGVKIDDFRLEKTTGGRNGQIRAVCSFPGGVPPGFIERLLTKCCHLGACDPFWRFGVLIGSGELFSAILEYRESDELVGKLTLEVFGDCTTAGPWGGMSACLSVVVQLLSGFPGMTAGAEVECQQHLSDNGIQIELSQVRSSCSRVGRGYVIDRLVPCLSSFAMLLTLVPHTHLYLSCCATPCTGSRGSGRPSSEMLMAVPVVRSDIRRWRGSFCCMFR